MHTIGRAALSALASLALVGCATPLTQALNPKVASAMTPVDVQLGIKQPELYGNFERSRAGQSAAAACGAVPGLGILLAAACGGAAGAIDASVNSSRAKAADEAIRPLKDEIVDLKFDQLMNDGIFTALKGVPNMRFSGVAVTKAVDDKEYEETFKASTAAGVMFVNVDYHMSTDLTWLQISARSLAYPRNATARTAAGLPAAIEGVSPGQPSMMDAKHAAYRANIVYRATLDKPGATPEQRIAMWKADNGRLLRNALQDGIAQVSRVLATDLQRAPDAPAAPSLAKMEVENRQQADVVAESHGGKLLRYPDGTLHFRTALAVASAVPTATAPTAPTAAR
jgi:hypothetical protein